MKWAQKTAVYGILHHHTRQLLLGGFNHAPLILSYEIIVYKGTAASLPVHLFTGLSSRIMWIELRSNVRNLRFSFSWDPSLQRK